MIRRGERQALWIRRDTAARLNVVAADRDVPASWLGDRLLNEALDLLGDSPITLTRKDDAHE